MDVVPTNKMNDMFDNVVVCTFSDFDSFEPNKYRSGYKKRIANGYFDT